MDKNHKLMPLIQDIKIIEKQKYYNEVLQSYEKCKVELTYKNTEEIINILNELNLLEKKGITSDNFTKKADSFYKHIKTLEEDFGYTIKDKTLPFNRPTDLKIKLDNILSSIDLKPTEIKDFTKELFLDESRRPKEKNIKPLYTQAKADNNIVIDTTKNITPLIKKEFYKNKPKPNNDKTILNINLELTNQEIKLLEEYIYKEYNDYYLGSLELYINDVLKELISTIKK